MNTGRTPLFFLDQDCQTLTKLVIEEVEAAGMQTFCSFDLDTLRSSSKGYICPTHSAASCTCQLIILLIFSKVRGQLTMIMEGDNHQTWVYLESAQGIAEDQVDPSLINVLFHAFQTKGLLR